MVFGKIYILTSKLTEKCYVGSTIYPYLSQRFNTHRNDYLSGTKDYQGLFGYDEQGILVEPEITLLEEIEFQHKDDLIKREQEWIDVYEDLCINKKRAYATPEQKQEQFVASVKKYHSSDKGKLSMRKANLRSGIKRMFVEIKNEKDNSIKEKEHIDEELSKYLTLCYEGIDSQYKDMYCEILDRQRLLSQSDKRTSKKQDTFDRYLIELSQLCPEDPLIKIHK